MLNSKDVEITCLRKLKANLVVGKRHNFVANVSLL